MEFSYALQYALLNDMGKLTKAVTSPPPPKAHSNDTECESNIKYRCLIKTHSYAHEFLCSYIITPEPGYLCSKACFQWSQLPHTSDPVTVVVKPIQTSWWSLDSPHYLYIAPLSEASDWAE